MAKEAENGQPERSSECDVLYPERWQGYHPSRINPQQKDLIKSVQSLFAEDIWRPVSTSGLYIPVPNPDISNARQIAIAYYTPSAIVDYGQNLEAAIGKIPGERISYKAGDESENKLVLPPRPLGPFPVTPESITDEFLGNLSPEAKDSITAISLIPCMGFIKKGESWHPERTAVNIVAFELTLTDHAPDIFVRFCDFTRLIPAALSLLDSSPDQS